MKNIFNNKVFIKLFFIPALFICLGLNSCTKSTASYNQFSFDVTCDMRKFAGPEYQTQQYFKGVCQAIKELGQGEFMISPGDIDPPKYVAETVKNVLGDNYPWYPVVGNHEAETPEDMEYLREWGSKDIPNLIRKGPKNGEETSYSFDFKNAHFAVINQYYDGNSDVGTNGDVTDPLYEWLKEDLEQNDKPFVFVIGHEPIVSMPDAGNGRHRHQGDCLDQQPETAHRFRQLLCDYNVAAYICGHTHNFSYAKINGVWQIDAGHARGIGDKGAKSTFIKIHVGTAECTAEVFRSDENCENYSLVYSFELD